MRKHKIIGLVIISALVLLALLLITINVWAQSEETTGNTSIQQATTAVDVVGYGRNIAAHTVTLDDEGVRTTTVVQGKRRRATFHDNAESFSPDLTGATDTWWTAVQAQLDRESYNLSSGPSGEGSSVSRHGYNRAHDFIVELGPAGVRLSSNDKLDRAPAAPENVARHLTGENLSAHEGQDQAAWRWGLTFIGYGYAGDVRPVGQPLQATAQGQRFEYRYPSAIVEWYINDERGLEHGFTLPAPPNSKPKTRDAQLILELALDTDLTPHLSSDQQALDFLSPGRVTMLRYDHLYVVDATGRQLPAHFSLSGVSISIVVDDTDAVYPLTVDPLTSSPVWTATGENTWDTFGYSVASAGDVNGDGYADAIVGAYGYNGYQGLAYVYHGSAVGLSATPSLTLTLTGQGAEHLGRSVASAGDVNGDGYADVIVGASRYLTNTGRAYVYHGAAAGLSSAPALTLTGENMDDYFGVSVASLGDVNGDGYADVVVGANGYLTDTGRAYVYHGSGTGLAATPVLTLTGENMDDRFGFSVASLGDVNGDGYADAIVGAYGYNTNQGRAYVYHGSGAGLVATPVLTLTGEHIITGFGWSVAGVGDANGDGYADAIVSAYVYNNEQGRVYVYHGSGVGLAATPALTLTGENTHNRFGYSVASVGDVNGDGYADAIVGATHYLTDTGRVYVYHGSGMGLVATPALTLTGENLYDQFGWSVAGVGDVDGDGYADAIVSAPFLSSRRGRTYVYHGSGAGLAATSALTLTGENTDDYFGYSVASAGDVNGDGYADVIVGARGYNVYQGGAYVYYGSGAGLSTTPALILTGENMDDEFGCSVASAGDVNGDGYADAIVGAMGYPYSISQGRAYIYHGSEAGLSATPALILTGENMDDYFADEVASAGDVNGDGYADIIVGASGLGRVYVYHGSGAGLAATPVLTLTGENSGDSFGVSVASLGDVNGDGYADVIVGAYRYGAIRGRVYVYHGSEVGLVATPALTLTGASDWNYFGYSVASAGDVNGDGYTDVIVGASGYPYGNDQGRAYIYLGSGTGLVSTPARTLTGENNNNYFGGSVAGAGDANGDGYADVIVGAYGYNSRQGRIYLYHGSETGLGATPSFTVTGENSDDYFGVSVAGAGDVNGDGYADVVVGAQGYLTYTGRAYVYHGNNGGGRTVLARQQRGDGSRAPVQGWGLSHAADGFQVQLRATDPRGRGRVKLQVQACPPGTAFDDAACANHVSAAWTDVTTATSGITLTEAITSLDMGVLYRWRARVLYAPQTVTAAGITPPPNPAHGPWRRWLGQAMEADVRTFRTELAVAKTVTPTMVVPGETVTYTYRVTNTGDVSLNGIVAVDDALGAVTLGTASLAPGAWTTGTLAYTVLEADLPGPLTNTVTVTGTPSVGANVTATDSASLLLTSSPAIIVAKTASQNSAGMGETITYTYHVTNTGNVSLHSITAVDDVLGAVTLGATSLTPGAWTTGTLAYTALESDLPGLLTNTVTVTGTPPAGADVTATDTVSVLLINSPAIAMASAGDVNGDGYADTIVGNSRYGGGQGQAHVYYGSAVGLSATPALTLTNQGSERLGCSVAGAGDVNGDGYADAIVGACGYGAGRGRAYVYYGSGTGLSATPALILTGENSGDWFAYSVASLGDVNGDGYADVVVGAYRYLDHHGRAYVYYGSAVGLSATPALTLTGENSGDSFGKLVASAGDVNGDGYADAILGASGYNSNQGRVYIYHGSGAGLAATPALTLTGQGTEYLGISASSAGDVNGDGYADAIIGAAGYNGEQGRAYVYHGSGAGLSATPALTLTGENIGDRFGYSVASAGDMNGDGYADAIVGILGYKSEQGQTYVYQGSVTGLTTTPAFTFTGENAGNLFGEVVGGAGDVNGDGYADTIVAASGYDSGQGQTYVYHGSGVGLSTMPALILTNENFDYSFGDSIASVGDINGDGYADFVVGARSYINYQDQVYIYHGSAVGPAATPALTLTGENIGDSFGLPVAGAGDVNGDGYADVVVGARDYDGGRGRVYVYHGSDAGLTATPALILTGQNADSALGSSVASAGDVNGDGYADVVVGAIGHGRVYVYHGSGAGLAATPALTLTGENINDLFGMSVAGAGDVNGDGYADVIVGAWGYPSNSSGGFTRYRGGVYVYHGSRTGLSATPAITLTGENDYDHFGYSVAGAGDVNGDGYADVVVGAYAYPSDDRQGRVYVYHGSGIGLAATPALTLTGENIQDSFGYSLAGVGDVNGDGYADAIVGVWGYKYYQGRVDVYHGSDTGLVATPAVTVTLTGQNADNAFGWSVAGAGDVNGDGYADAIVGAPGYNGYLGRVDVYHGNDGGGRMVQVRQQRGDGSGVPVQGWGLSHAVDGFQVQLRATDPHGRGRAKLQVQACPSGTAFDDMACVNHVSTVWTDVTTATSGVTLTEIITGLDAGTLYRWRARVLYAPQTVTAMGITPPPNPAHGPWRRWLGQAMEADVRTFRTELAVAKTVTPTVAAPGETVTYTYRVTNTGDVSLSGIMAVDDRLGTVALYYRLGTAVLSTTNLAPGAWATDTLTYTVREADLPGPLTNTVTVTGTPPVGADVTATNSASLLLTSHPAIAVVKTASQDSAEMGETITYTYRVTNTGDVSLSGIMAVDDRLGTVALYYRLGTAVLSTTNLAPGAWATGTLAYTVVEADLPGPLTNTVTATGTPPVGVDVTATDNASVVLVSSPAIAVAKTASQDSAGMGDTITYTYRVTNTGDVSLGGIVAVDDALGAVPLGTANLASGAWTTGSLAYTVLDADLPGPLTNTVTVTGTPPVGVGVIARDTIVILLTENESKYRVWLPLVTKSFQP